jgi:hypothetical protein
LIVGGRGQERRLPARAGRAREDRERGEVGQVQVGVLIDGVERVLEERPDVELPKLQIDADLAVDGPDPRRADVARRVGLAAAAAARDVRHTIAYPNVVPFRKAITVMHIY